jgi:hypothetical protein
MQKHIRVLVQRCAEMRRNEERKSIQSLRKFFKENWTECVGLMLVQVLVYRDIGGGIRCRRSPG